MHSYYNFEASLEVLRHGIKATKYNFSDPNSKQVDLQLSPNHKSLIYKSNYKSPVLDFFRGDPSLNLDDVQGVIFGGQTSAFLRHKVKQLKHLEKIRIPDR